MNLLFALAIVGAGLTAVAAVWLKLTQGDSGWAFALIVFGGIILLVFGGIWGAFKSDEIGCRNTAKVAGLEHRWSVSTSCMVKFQGKWIPYDRWVYLTGGER